MRVTVRSKVTVKVQVSRVRLRERIRVEDFGHGGVRA